MNLPSSRDVLWSVGIWTLCSWGSFPGSAPLLVFPEPEGKKTKHASLIFNRSQIFLLNEVTCLLLNLLVNIFKTNRLSLICDLVEDPWSFQCNFFSMWLFFFWSEKFRTFSGNCEPHCSLETLLHASFHLSACHRLAVGHQFAAPPYCTLMISTSWSTPLSPGKMGWPRSSSASTQPADQMSMLDV